MDKLLHQIIDNHRTRSTGHSSTSDSLLGDCAAALLMPSCNVSTDELDLLDHILAMDERGDLTDEEVHQ